MATGTAQSFLTPNYSGMLFNAGATATPFSSMIGGRMRTVNAVEFPTGVIYTSGGGTQPDIDETDSLVAPDPAYFARTQTTNVTQIFQEAVAISYGKMSNMGTMSGVNLANQKANPPSELDFQVAATMAKIAQDIEATFMAGAYQKAGNDTTSNKSRGMFTAITTNSMDLAGAALRVWDIAELQKMIYDSNADPSGLVLFVDPVALFQLTVDAEANGLTIVPAARNVNGINLSELLTPFGPVNIQLGKYIPSGYVGLFNLDVIQRVEQPVPGKGNFFLEELAKVGAATPYQIYGQIGLDHGPEWYHGEISNISTAFTKPKSGKKVYIEDAVPVADVLPVIDVVTLGNLKQNVESSALTITYVGDLSSGASLAYVWKSSATAKGTYAAISGATSATYTPQAGDVGKYIKVEVTATGTATGVALSNAKLVAAAG